MNAQDPNLPPPGGRAARRRRRLTGAGRGAAQQFFHCQDHHGGAGPGLSGIGLLYGRAAGAGDGIAPGQAGGQGAQALLGPGPHWAWPAPIDEVIKLHIDIPDQRRLDRRLVSDGGRARQRRGGAAGPSEPARSGQQQLRLERGHQHHPCHGERKIPDHRTRSRSISIFPTRRPSSPTPSTTPCWWRPARFRWTTF